MRALTHVWGMRLPTVGTLAGLSRHACTRCTSLPLTLLRLPLRLLSLLGAWALLLPPADGCEQLIVCSSTLSHSRDDLIQSGVVIIGRANELRHVGRPGLDRALKSTCLTP